ncbi:MAG: GTPase Era [Coxiellaceae bacterium]|nr:GTPase Era [Coxiellaceae bacterium]
MSDESRCGYVAIIGRPNVGKSTLLNYLVGQKVSITARKPQTTRNRILGIHTYGHVQAVYVDTPGVHSDAKKALNKQLNRTALRTIPDVDVILFMVEGTKITGDDEWILHKLKGVSVPVLLVVNKVDRLDDKSILLPHIEKLMEQMHFAEVIPLAALTGDNVSSLDACVAKYLPEGVHLFPEDQVTDKSDRFFVAEVIREKLIRHLGQEVPHAIAISLEKYAEENNILHISAVIWVEREGQKKIVIGKQGEMLKKIGTLARQELEDQFNIKIFLQLWVKVKRGWSDDERAIETLGFKEDK